MSFDTTYQEAKGHAQNIYEQKSNSGHSLQQEYVWLLGKLSCMKDEFDRFFERHLKLYEIEKIMAKKIRPSEAISEIKKVISRD
jgi:hypothetical protein